MLQLRFGHCASALQGKFHPELNGYFLQGLIILECWPLFLNLIGTNIPVFHRDNVEVTMNTIE